MILLAIVGGQPRELGLCRCCKLFIEHRIEVVRRRTQFELRKAEEREHILLGFKIALDHCDEHHQDDSHESKSSRRKRAKPA